jgi:hypothetical protein
LEEELKVVRYLQGVLMMNECGGLQSRVGNGEEKKGGTGNAERE